MINNSDTKLHFFKTLFFFFLVLSSQIAFAGNGKITGRIIDSETKEPLPGVNILVIQKILSDGKVVPMDQVIGAATDIDGYYFILNVSPGTYNLKASLVGYAPVLQTEIKVDLDRTIEINFELSTSAIEVEEVVVVAKKELVKKDVSGTQEVIASVRLEQTPVLRVDEFIGKLKGIELVSGEQGSGLSVRGGAIRETDVRLDGISLQDPRSDNSYLSFNSTTMSEIQVLTSGFDAKYGGIRSGLLNVITKEGSRSRYTVSLQTNVAPSGQRRYFGNDPWSDDSWIYRVYAGEYAWTGVPVGDSLVPVEFKDFKGWKKTRTRELKDLDSLQRLEVWKAQHPQYGYQEKPDYYFEGSITGPLPGDFIPVFGKYAEITTFLLGFKYENTQFAFPLGPRDNYVDWNAQLKLTSQLSKSMKLSINGMYAKINSLSGGSTTNYGGALVDNSSSFSFLNNSESSVVQQARLINGNNIAQLFNKSRLQFFDQQYIIGGAKFTHTLNASTFYTIDFQIGLTDQNLQPFALDTTNLNNYFFITDTAGHVQKFNLPQFGSPNAATNFLDDAIGIFRTSGGLQRIDSSYSRVYQLKGDITSQVNRNNQVEAGFSVKMQDLFVYAGTWNQSFLAYSPDTWQYYDATPLEIGLYAQDKLEFEGMILNVGLRLDYFDPLKKGYQVGFPSDPSYTALWNEIYNNLPGDYMSYERWVEFRSLLENPPGWPQTEDNVQVYLSPRLGVSFPLTETSKLYFNYGHFYQRPPISMLYNTYVGISSVGVPTPGLKMGRTVQYEFGYEHLIMDDFIFNTTAYYKDITNEPLSRVYHNYYEDNIVIQYTPDRYRDIRGIELRLEKPIGRFISFNAMYDYMIVSSGQTGLSDVYENLIISKDGIKRSAAVITTDPRPRANINLNLHTPSDFGPELLGINWLSDIYANFFFEWQDGGRFLLNPEAQIKDWNYVDVVNYWNIDFRASKAFNFGFGSIEFILTVKNLTNNKWLNTSNMTTSEYNNYKSSLKTPDKGGDDLWGEYKKDYIKVGWNDASLFVNPRRVLFGVRVNF